MNTWRKLSETLRQTVVFLANSIALFRQEAQPHQEQDVTLSQMDISTIAIEIGAPVVDLPIKNIPFPQECLIARVRRGKQVFIPHGDTVLRAGDVLAVVVDGAARVEVLRLCRQPDGELPKLEK